MKKYYYINSAKQQMGPIDAEDFVRLGLGSSTYVWCEGMPNWTLASQVPDLLPYLSSAGSTFGGAIPPRFDTPRHNMGTQSNTPIPPRPACPDNYLVWAILTTIFCCLPFGIVAIVKSTKVEKLWMQGYQQEAENMSRDAKRWCIISALSSLIFTFIYFILYFFIFAASMSSAFLL